MSANIFIPADTDKRVVHIVFRFFTNGSNGTNDEVFIIVRVVNDTFNPVTHFKHVSHPQWKLVETTGLEPATSCLQGRRSPN